MAFLRALTTAGLLICRAHSCEDRGGCEHEESSLLQRGSQRQLALLERCQPSTPGIYWALDGEAKHAADLNGWQPLDVPNRSRLDLLVCNVGNAAVSGNVLPALLGSVGAGARVHVGVQDSFNVALAGNLSLKDGASLMPTVVQGTVLPGARVVVQLSGSGNVKGTGSLEVLGASLLAPLLVGDVEGARVEVELERCGNVEADELRLDNASAALLMPVLHAAGIQASTLRLRLEGCGNVRGEVLTVNAGQLLEVLVNVSEVAASTLELRVEDAGQVTGRHVEVSGMLLRGLLRASGSLVKNANISGELKNAALLRAKNVSLSGGELLSAALDLPDVVGGKVSLEVSEAGNVKCSSFRMGGGNLVAGAVRTRGAFREQARVQVSLTKVASLDVGDAEVAGGILFIVLESAEGMSNGSMDVTMEEVGCVRGHTVRFVGRGRFALDILDLRDASAFNRDSTISVSMVKSFNFYVWGALSLDGDDLFQDLIDMSFQRCEVSFMIQDSVNSWVGGDMQVREEVVADLQRGEVRNSTYRAQILRSFSFVARGSYSISAASVIADLFDGNIEEESKVSISIVESLRAEAQGDVSFGGSSDFINDLLDDEVVNSSVSISILKSGIVEAQGAVSMQLFSKVFEDLVTDAVRNSSLTLVMKGSAKVHGRSVLMENSRLIQDFLDDLASDSKISMEVDDSVQVVAKDDVVMFDSVLVERVLDGDELRSTSFAFLAGDFGSVKAGGAVSLERSGMVLELASASFAGSRVLYSLENAFNVEAGRDFSMVSRGLVTALVRSTRITEGSEVSVALDHAASIEAGAVAMNSSSIIFVGLSTLVSFSNSSASLTLKHAAVLEAPRVELRQSSLLASLFGPAPQRENARLRAELQEAAGLEVAASARLFFSSLLGSLGSLEDAKLSIQESGLASCDGRALLTLENSVLCADGAAALQAAAKRFKESCEAQACRQA